MPSWIQEGFREYARRMPAEMRLELLELKPEERGAARSADKAMRLESERLLAAVPDKATLVALDERGKSVSTRALSLLLKQWMQEGVQPCFAIGGADGLSEAVKTRADKLLSLSALTLPHGLVRVVLAEQLYRPW